jgi:hypothetical protein
MSTPLAADDLPPNRDDGDPLDIAALIVAVVVESAALVVHDRKDDPDAFPGYGPSPDDFEVIGRRAVAGLLNAGWTPPGTPAPVPPRRRPLADTFRRLYARLITLRSPRTPAPDPGE